MEVQGYPKYLIYPDGRVWSRKRKIFMKHQNTSGGYLHVILCHHGKNISYDKEHNTWMYKKIYQKKRHQKNFKTKIDALCYKFIHQLKLKVLR